MASTTPVSAPIKALLEQLGSALAGQGPMPTPAAIYAQLIRIRDEAELLEVRATARDAKVAELLAEIAAIVTGVERQRDPDAPTIMHLAARHGALLPEGERP